MAVGKVASISFEHMGVLYEMDALIDGFGIEDNCSSDAIYDWGGSLCSFVHTPAYRISISGEVVPSRKHGHEGLWFSRELSQEEITA